jgi:hypothetical protein
MGYIISAGFFLFGMITGLPEWFGLCGKYDFDCQFSVRLTGCLCC